MDNLLPNTAPFSSTEALITHLKQLDSVRCFDASNLPRPASPEGQCWEAGGGADCACCALNSLCGVCSFNMRMAARRAEGMCCKDGDRLPGFPGELSLVLRDLTEQELLNGAGMDYLLVHQLALTYSRGLGGPSEARLILPSTTSTREQSRPKAVQDRPYTFPLLFEWLRRWWGCTTGQKTQRLPNH